MSGLDQAGRDIRFLILSDGLFHAVMYAVTMLGLALLWKARRQVARARDGHAILMMAVAGFGVWHMIDGLVSHWLLGLHRVRMDVDNPLACDLAWFLGFGLLPVIWACFADRHPPVRDRFQSAPAALVVAAMMAAPVLTLPPSSDGPVIVYFSPSLSPAQKFAAVGAVDGRMVWTDPSQQVCAIDIPDDRKARSLFARGAIFVSKSFLPAGCFDWMATGKAAI